MAEEIKAKQKAGWTLQAESYTDFAMEGGKLATVVSLHKKVCATAIDASEGKQNLQVAPFEP